MIGFKPLIIVVVLFLTNFSFISLSSPLNKRQACSFTTSEFSGSAKVTDSEGLNIREEPCTDSAKVGAHNFGDTFSFSLVSDDGECVNGIKTWLFSEKGWSWSGATNFGSPFRC